MPANTPKLALPYPLGTDPVSDGDDQIKALAEKLDRSGYAYLAGLASGGPIASGGATLIVPVVRNIGNIYNVATGEMTVPADGAGLWHLTGTMSFAQHATGSYRLLQTYRKTGAGAFTEQGRAASPVSAGGNLGCSLSQYLDLLAGDMVRWGVFQEDTGAAMTIPPPGITIAARLIIPL